MLIIGQLKKEMYMSNWPTTSVHGVNAVNFDFMTTANWNEALSSAVEGYLQRVNTVAHDVSAPTFENTLLVLEHASSVLSDTFSALMCAKFHATEDMLELTSTWSPRITQICAEALQNEEVFARLQAAHRANENWSAEQIKLYEDWAWEFKEAGCGLSVSDKQRICQLKTKLSRLETEFDHLNLKNANNTIPVRAKQLSAAPEGLLDQCARAQKDGVEYVCIPVNSAHVEPLLETLPDRAAREQLWRAWTGRGKGQTEGDVSTADLTQSILRARGELATVLGYANWAEYMMARRMESAPDTILKVLRTTWDSLNSAAKDNLAHLQSWSEDQGLPDSLQPWDVPYYSHLYQQEHYNLLKDINIKEYLPLPVVRQAAFNAATQLFGVTFEEDPTIPTYHPDAVGYVVRDGDHTLGTLLVDDFARPSKEPGAWMNVFAAAHQLNGGNNAGVINVLNIPVSPPGTPTLLSYDEMITIFHELGHGLHGLLGKTTYPSHSGTNVSRDFVELPSQLLENWGNNPECFLNMAQHWKTHEKMPAEVFAQMKEGTFLSERFMKIAYLQSAFTDLLMHTRPYQGQDVNEWERQIVEELDGPRAIPPRHGAAHFSHVFGGGYAAGYYSYLWAEILEADIASQFQNNFLHPDPTVCAAVKKLYQAGGSAQASELFVQCRGRAPDPTALLKRLGIAPQKGPSMV